MGEAQPTTPPAAPALQIAVIDESRCIGCTLCLPPCPVDAIVGANNRIHTVIAAECTGCELCIPACPVDCISLQTLPQPHPPVSTATRRSARLRGHPVPEVAPRGCINCGRCNVVCPVVLPAQELLHAVQGGQSTLAADLGLDRCIECGLCDRACPSQIPMAQLFAGAKAQQAQQLQQDQAKQHYKDRYAAHTTRLAAQAQAALRKREQRLQNAGRWS